MYSIAADKAVVFEIPVTTQVHSSRVHAYTLALLDKHSWHDRTECHDRRFYPMGQESQVWARGSRLESDGNRMFKSPLVRGDSEP